MPNLTRIALALPFLLTVARAQSLPITTGVGRPWVGPEFYGNRLQDWRLRDGRIECVESRRAKPMRAMHILSVSASGRPGSLRAQARIGATGQPDGSGAPDACGGFLIGTGGDAIDYRLSALVHHRPARDGGMVVGIDGRGRIVFRDFEHNVKRGGWGITGALDEAECREIAATSSQGDPIPLPCVLRVEARPDAGTYNLVVSAAHTRDDGSRITALATLSGVDPALIEGQISLCSHLSPSGGKDAGFAFDQVAISGSKIDRHRDRRFGPIVATQYTVSSTVRLTAQMAALGAADNDRATLEVAAADGSGWRQVAVATLDRDARTFGFEFAHAEHGLDPTQDIPFRVAYDLLVGADALSERHHWSGTIRGALSMRDPVTVAAFTGNKHFTGGIRWNHDGVWFPHAQLTEAVRWHRPDLLFFSGDQIYEGDLTGVQRRPVEGAILDYLDKWYRWCFAFGDLARDVPCICIPDDHDVFHGNIWGAGGRAAKRQDDGGYTMPPRFVNMVERTQTSHLPRSPDPAPCPSGIGVYFTSMQLGAVDFAILEDRKFKSSPTELCIGGDCKNGWFQNPDYDPVTQADVEGAELLGERQLAFLSDWARRRPKGVMKCALSQTIFANVATLPAQAKSGSVLPRVGHPKAGVYPTGERLAADADSNGWPQSGRNAAVRLLAQAGAFHIAGDQHLGSVIRYGVESWTDAGFAICVPSIANTWPRRWFPPEPGADRQPNSPRYTGRFRDGFGNRMTVLAVSNPRDGAHRPKALHDRAPGYGIVRFDPGAATIRIECWPRSSNPASAGARQYPGWPITLRNNEVLR